MPAFVKFLSWWWLQEVEGRGSEMVLNDHGFGAVGLESDVSKQQREDLSYEVVSKMQDYNDKSLQNIQTKTFLVK